MAARRDEPSWYVRGSGATGRQHADRARTAYRTGPIGRLARVLLLAVSVVGLEALLDQGGAASFRRASILADPAFWALNAITFTLYVHLVGELGPALTGRGDRRRWRLTAVAGLAAVLGVAALAARVWFGAVWGFPVADVVWSLDTLMVLQTVVALPLAIALGTPGCEIGVWPELIGRAGRGQSDRSPWVACVVGLDFVDAWEARRRRQAEAT